MPLWWCLVPEPCKPDELCTAQLAQHACNGGYLSCSGSRPQTLNSKSLVLTCYCTPIEGVVQYWQAGLPTAVATTTSIVQRLPCRPHLNAQAATAAGKAQSSAGMAGVMN